ncbi:MAG: hypothetical protein WC454_02385 [Phycisphaerae bacterium]|jgi:hypothetical protein
MRSKPYKQKPGDFEIRILRDGHVIMLVPDEKLLEVADAIESRAGEIKRVNGDSNECQNLNQRN